MSEYTRAVFGSLDQGQADFTQTYTALQTEVTGLDAKVPCWLSAPSAPWQAPQAGRAGR